MFNITIYAFNITDTFSALMAVCASQCNTEDHLLLCAKQLLVSGALVNAFDRSVVCASNYIVFLSVHKKA